MITSCSSFGLHFPDSDEKLESHSMTKPYALSLGVTGKRMKKTLLQRGGPYLFTKIFIIYAIKVKTW